MFDHDSFVVLFSEVSLESIPVIAHSLAIRTGELEVTIQMGNDHMGLGFLLLKDSRILRQIMNSLPRRKSFVKCV